MLTHLDYLKDRLRTSFWFVPAAMTLAAIGMALAMLWLDGSTLAPTVNRWTAPYAVGAEGARLVLSTIAGSMITVASLVFSMTLVALTMAASSIGARLLDRYIANRVNQVALGLFLATFVYSLIVLRAVSDGQGRVFVPHLSVSLAMALAILSFGWLIYFIHDLATSIQVDNTVAQVAAELGLALRRLGPPDRDADAHPAVMALHGETRAGMPRATVAAGCSGYLQTIDAAELIALATAHDVIIEMRHRPGDFVIPSSPLALVAGATEVDEQLGAGIRASVVFGPKRTAAQDLEFSIALLVEVAARALSPGINDFYTAIACIDHLTAALALTLTKGLPSPLGHDDAGRLRLELCPLTFATLADAAFDPIRQSAAGSVPVMVRLLESLTLLTADAEQPVEQACLCRHGERVRAMARREVADAHDRSTIEARFAALQAALRAKAGAPPPGRSDPG